MKRFKDKDGREWKVELTFGAVERVREEADVDLLDLSGENVLIQLSRDTRRIMHVIYALLKPQIEAAGLTPEQFGEALAGPQVADACDAFREEWFDFFQNPAERRVLQRAQEKVTEFETKAQEMILDRMGPGQAMDRMMEQVLQEASARTETLCAPSSGDLPGPSASTPGPSPGDSST